MKIYIISFLGLLSSTLMCSISVPINLDIVGLTAEKVVLSRYNPEWANIYKRESTTLRSILGNKRVKGIQHFGSTSIPGMIAKPIIDIIVGLDEFRLEENERKSLINLGYEFIEESPYCNRYYLQKKHGEKINLSLTTYNSETWKDCLAVRDFLLNNTSDRMSYMYIKLAALLDGNNDIVRYSKYKREFVKNLSDKARSWRSDE